jgi:hypothetical protein
MSSLVELCGLAFVPFGEQEMHLMSRTSSEYMLELIRTDQDRQKPRVAMVKGSALIAGRANPSGWHARFFR